MARYNNLDAHFSGPLHDAIKILNLEPQQHAVSIWFVLTIADPTVMVFYFKAVQLKYELAL